MQPIIKRFCPLRVCLPFQERIGVIKYLIYANDSISAYRACRTLPPRLLAGILASSNWYVAIFEICYVIIL